MSQLNTLEYAKESDLKDPLQSLRSEFCFPSIVPGKEVVYLCGNSLGLLPKQTKTLLNEELDVWGAKGVYGHFEHPYNRPWVDIDAHVIHESARIVGALDEEVAIMNSLTANLHFLMIRFYKPTSKRFKIIMEAKAFPSDYVLFLLFISIVCH